jgi:hypothetical protein
VALELRCGDDHDGRLLLTVDAIPAGGIPILKSEFLF